MPRRKSSQQWGNSMLDKEILAQMNGKYACPPDAGPAWREAMAAGIDMSLIEHALTLTPEQRLAEHQQVIDFLLSIKGVGSANGAETKFSYGEFRFLSLDALIASKQATGRERDQEALRKLRA